MKNLFLMGVCVLSLALVAFQPFSGENHDFTLINNSNSLVKIIDNEALMRKFEKAHPQLFDQIDALELHQTAQNDFMVNILGKKDGSSKSQFILVTKYDVESDFTQLDFDNTDRSEVEYCYVDLTGSCPYYDTCKTQGVFSCSELVICGEWNGSRCFKY
ncbi:MAG: hypothetical protein R3359_06795 [Marinirhabdus sp.]|nr:hypothetical protein [Marinirhabdus sp.]